MNKCTIYGLGTYTPTHTITNHDLAHMVATTDEWIVTRTGIRQRHQLAPEETASDAGVAAAHKALHEAAISPTDVTHVLVGTCTPDALCPSTACIIANKLGCGHVMALDYNAACSGFIYGLELGRSVMALQPNAVILLICTEALTRRINWQDRSTCVLFGDGAGAVVLRRGADTQGITVRDVRCTSDGTLHELIRIGGGTEKRFELGQTIEEDFFVSMQGREVFKHAVRSMVNICQDILTHNALSMADVDVLVPHQANMRIIEAVGSRLDIPGERVFTNVAEYGNTSSASVPLALDDARRQGIITRGKRVLVTSFGGGLTWGAALLEW